MPEPATRSLTVEDTNTSSVAARAPIRAAMFTAIPPMSSSDRSSTSPAWSPIRSGRQISVAPVRRHRPLAGKHPLDLAERGVAAAGEAHVVDPGQVNEAGPLDLLAHPL